MQGKSIRGRPCRWRSRLRRLGQSRRFQGAVNTSSKDIGGKSARLLERHRQVEAFDPGDAAIAQRGLVSWRTAGAATWRCGRGLRVGWRPLPFHRQGRWPRPPWVAAPSRMRSLADEITDAATRKALRRPGKVRALVRDSTYIEHPSRSATRARQTVASHVRMSVMRAASRQQPRQRSGSLRGQTERLSAHAGARRLRAALNRAAA